MVPKKSPTTEDKKQSGYDPNAEESRKGLYPPEVLDCAAKLFIPGPDSGNYGVGQIIATQGFMPLYKTLDANLAIGNLGKEVGCRIEAIAARVTSGNLTDLETALVGQFFLLNSRLEFLWSKQPIARMSKTQCALWTVR